MIIDAHHHLWTADYPWLATPELKPIRRDYTVDDMRVARAATGVQASVLVEAGRCDLEETRAFLDLARQTSDIVGVVGWVSFVDTSVAETVAMLRAEAGGRWLVGVRDQVQGERDPAYLTRGDVRHNLAGLGQAGLAVDLVVRRDQLPAAAVMARACPDTVFVLDHLGKPVVNATGLAEWRTLVSPFAACDNTVAKLSGLLTEMPSHGQVDHAQAIAPFVETALDLFGPNRLMVGSDWPVCELVAPYADAWHSVQASLVNLSLDERHAVNAATAIRTYRLEIPQ